MKPCKMCGCSNPEIHDHNGRKSYGCSMYGCVEAPIRDSTEEAEAAWDILMDEPKKAARKPVTIIDTPAGVVALCDDGSVFINPVHHIHWVKRNPIPGTEADK